MDSVHALLVTSEGKLILQPKSERYTIQPANRGKITMYGGGAEVGEREEETLARELYEELQFDISNYEYTKLRTYKKTLEEDGIAHNVHVYIVRGVNPEILTPDTDDDEEAAEDMIIDTSDNFLDKSNLTRVTRAAIEDFRVKD